MLKSAESPIAFWLQLSRQFKERFGRPAGSLKPAALEVWNTLVAEYGPAAALIAADHWMTDKQALLKRQTTLGLWGPLTDFSRDEYFEQAADGRRVQPVRRR